MTNFEITVFFCSCADESDYIPLVNQEFIIPASSSVDESHCFAFQIRGDRIHESDETLSIVIHTENSDDVISGESTVDICILDDGDGKFPIAIRVSQLLFTLKGAALLLQQLSVPHTQTQCVCILQFL